MRFVSRWRSPVRRDRCCSKRCASQSPSSIAQELPRTRACGPSADRGAPGAPIPTRPEPAVSSRSRGECRSGCSDMARVSLSGGATARLRAVRSPPFDRSWALDGSAGANVTGNDTEARLPRAPLRVSRRGWARPRRRRARGRRSANASALSARRLSSAGSSSTSAITSPGSRRSATTQPSTPTIVEPPVHSWPRSVPSRSAQATAIRLMRALAIAISTSGGRSPGGRGTSGQLVGTVSSSPRPAPPSASAPGTPGRSRSSSPPGRPVCRSPAGDRSPG